MQKGATQVHGKYTSVTQFHRRNFKVRVLCHANFCKLTWYGQHIEIFGRRSVLPTSGILFLCVLCGLRAGNIIVTRSKTTNDLWLSWKLFFSKHSLIGLECGVLRIALQFWILFLLFYTSV